MVSFDLLGQDCTRSPLDVEYSAVREGLLLAVTGGGLVARGHKVGVHVVGAVAEEKADDDFTE